MTTHTNFRHEQLHAFALTVLRAGGCSEVEAGQVADHLVDANLSGHDSHGIGLIPVYVDLIQAGLIVPDHQVEVVSDLGAVLVLDAGRGFGHAMATQAMDLGIAKARQLGAVIVALRTSGHCGRIGAWAEHCARAGFASIHFVNGIDHRPLQAPFTAAADASA